MTWTVDRVTRETESIGGSMLGRAVVALAALILHLAGLYSPTVPGGDAVGATGAAGLGHLVVFALLTWALMRLVAPVRRFPAGWVVVAMLLHAGFSELIQHVALDGRSGQWGDVAADLLGVVVGVAAWIIERHLIAQSRAAELAADAEIDARDPAPHV